MVTYRDRHGEASCLRFCKPPLDAVAVNQYLTAVIATFRSKALQRFFESGDGRKLSVQNTPRIKRILVSLDDAERPEDMNLPGFRLHARKGAAKGRYAVDVSGNWRITFGWHGKSATEIDLEDYH
jgi:proteic killer suppression protein